MIDAGKPGASSAGQTGVTVAFGALALGILAALALASLGSAEQAAAAKLRGEVKSGSKKLGSVPVTLYRAGRANSSPKQLARARTRRNGTFKFNYRAPRRSNTVLYAIAGRQAAVRLAAVLGTPQFPRKVVLNERTTVAAGFALAEFLHGAKKFAGSSPGLKNAAAMAANLAHVPNGGLAKVLRQAPNGGQTSTLRTFNSLSNMLPQCARSTRQCARLFRLATPPGGSAPRGTLKAIANIARSPAHRVQGLFNLAGSRPAPYGPALGSGELPDAWTLALRFDGPPSTPGLVPCAPGRTPNGNQ